MGLFKQDHMPDANGYILLGPICREQIGMQAQYGCRYSQDLCADLRFKGTMADYHGMKIHQDDVATYVQRVMDYRRKMGVIA